MMSYPIAIEKIINRMNDKGFKAYLVGGCVRDYLMGISPHDFDIATDALPEQVIDIFPFSIPTGIKHGTVTVPIDGINVEITTFRSDGKYKDNRHPENVYFTASYRDDAARRDFTINAMAYDANDGVIDYFGGHEDLKNKLIRCVGVPDVRFKEDSLRILRALRFSSTLDFKIENETSNSIIKNKDLLKNISAERLASELIKLLCGKNAKNVLMQYSSVISIVIPEIEPMIGFRQHNPHHIYDVWEHTCNAVENIVPVPHLRLAAFFHDIGKPHTFSTDVNGIGHFYGHAHISCDIAESIMKRLKLDNATISKTLTIIKYHDLQIPIDNVLIKRHINKLTPELFFDLIQMFRADNAALDPKYSDRQAHYDDIENTAKQILSENSCFSLKMLAVNGNDIIQLGISTGKQIGKILNTLLELVMSEKLPNEKDALIDYVSENLDILLKK